MERRAATRGTRRTLAVVGAAALALLAIVAGRSCGLLGQRSPDSSPTRDALGGWRADGDGLVPPSLGAPLPPSTGWEEAAETIAVDLAALLDGHARTGAFAEAQAEAARQDLALYPPDAAKVRRMLLAGTRERTWALVAVAVLPDVDDDLVRLLLRSLRPEDDDLQRLLTAEAVAALPPELLARHEEELLGAFAGETNPLVLAEALPALERMETERLRALVERQL